MILFHLMAFKLQPYTDNNEISNPSPDLFPKFQAHAVTSSACLFQRLQDIANLLHTNQIPHFHPQTCSSGGLCSSIDGNFILLVVEAKVSHSVNLKIYPEINFIFFTSFLAFLPWSGLSHPMQSLSNWSPCFHSYPTVYTQQSHQDNFFLRFY